MSDPDETRLPTTAGGATIARGIQRVWDPRVWGTVVGAVGATVFVLSNRNDLEGPWPTVALLAWTAGLASYAWSVFGARRYFPDFQPVSRRAGLVYFGSVGGMLALIRLGGLLLEPQDRNPLRPALIVLAVGLHFLPFAWAFRTPMFTTLGLLMAGLGVVGLGLGWFWTHTAVSAIAVIAGLVMLAVMAMDAARNGATAAVAARAGVGYVPRR